MESAVSEDLLSASSLRLVDLTARNEVTGSLLSINEARLELQKQPVSRDETAEVRSATLRDLPVGVSFDDEWLTFAPGYVYLSSTLEVPKEYSVRLLPGLRLELARDASLIVHGNLEAIGTTANPIKISGRSAESRWGSLVVQGRRTSPSRVHLEHVSLHGGTGGENARSPFSGSLTVIDGVVIMRNCSFRDLEAEDGINIRYSKVFIRDNYVSNAADDAVDLDFCAGLFAGNEVSGAGGDCLDLSGSSLQVKNNLLSSCKDKGISVGERSAAEIIENRIRGCRTGIAAKDGSRVLVRSNVFARLEVAVALYRKKLTFAEPSAHVDSVDLKDVSSPWLLGPRVESSFLVTRVEVY